MTVQIVKPAGAGHETGVVLAACAAILVAAAAYIGLSPAEPQTAALEASQLDARRDLTPAEQGIFADLRVVHDELRLMAAPGQPQPGAQALADEGLPPFAQDVSSATRGGHVWSDGQAHGHTLYLGRTADAEVAGSFLLIAPAASAGAGDAAPAGQAPAGPAEPEVWLQRSAQARLPADTDPTTLADSGWRQIVAQFDAGVTRQHRH